MKITEVVNETFIGYRVVGQDGKKFFSLYSQEQLHLTIGKETADPNGFYLATTEEFATDYYTGLSDYDDALLKYEYNLNDVIKGNPHGSAGEIIVSRAKLLEINTIN